MKQNNCFLILLLCICLIKNIYADFDDGMNAYRKGKNTVSDQRGLDIKEYLKALNLWKPLAENGDSKAQYYVGLLYDKLHIGLDEILQKLVITTKSDYEYNTEQTLYWLTKSAENGYADAQYYLGYLYYNDDNYVGINEQKSIYWLKKAVENNNPHAKVLLGDCYKEGFGVKRNKKEAARLYKEAFDFWLPLAENGDYMAYEYLGDMFYKGGECSKNELPKVFNFHLSSARLGNPTSLNQLGYMIFKGSGVIKNNKKAIDLLKLGAKYKYYNCVSTLDYIARELKDRQLIEYTKYYLESELIKNTCYLNEYDDYRIKDPTLAQKIDDIIAGKYQEPELQYTTTMSQPKPAEPIKPQSPILPAIQSESDFWNTVEKIISNSKDDNQNKQAIDYIQNNSSILAPKLLEKINSTTDDPSLNIYLWLLGFTNDQNSAKDLIELHSKTKSENIQYVILTTLGRLGGEKSGKFLMTQYKKAKTDDDKFNYLNLLAQIKYEPALKYCESILKKSPQEFYWQNNFIFGKYGDVAVPYLIENIRSSNKNIKYNSIMMLGKWLVAPEALKPFQEQYSKEKDLETKQMLLSLMEGLISDFKELESFYKSIAEKEKDEELKNFATETIEEMIPKMKDEIAEFSKSQKNKDAFNQEYDKLYKGNGHGGDYEILKSNSLPEDETKLKALREVILQRNSDEAFYDYEAVNGIIVMNRYIKANEDVKDRNNE